MVLGDSKKKWLHSADVLIRSRVSYQVKFVGKVEVNQPKGIEVARSALQKLSFNKQIKRSEGTKPAKVQLSINVKGITISDNRTKEVLHNVPLHLISFCSDDKKDKHLFSFIAKVGEENKHYCFGFESGNEANNITLSIGQAFDVAYQEFLKKKKDGAASITGNSSSKQMRELHNKVNELALENTKLKERIAQLEGEKNKDAKKSEAASKCISGSLSSTVQSTTCDPLLAASQDSFFHRFLQLSAPSTMTSSNDATSYDVITSAHVTASGYILPPPIDTFSNFSLSHSSSSGLSQPLSSCSNVQSSLNDIDDNDSVSVLVQQAKTKLTTVRSLLGRLRKKAKIDDPFMEDSPTPSNRTQSSMDEKENLMSVLAADSSLYENLTHSLAQAVAGNNPSLTPDNASELLASVNEALNVLQEESECGAISLSTLPPPINPSPSIYGCELRETVLDDFDALPPSSSECGFVPFRSVSEITKPTPPPIPTKPPHMCSNPHLFTCGSSSSLDYNSWTDSPKPPPHQFSSSVCDTDEYEIFDHQQSPTTTAAGQAFESPLYHAIGGCNSTKLLPPNKPLRESDYLQFATKNNNDHRGSNAVSNDRFIDSESAFLSFFDHPLDETLQRFSGESGYTELKKLAPKNATEYDENVHRFMEAVRRENSSQLLKQKNVLFAATPRQMVPQPPPHNFTTPPANDDGHDVVSFSTCRTDTPSISLQPPPPPSLASNKPDERSSYPPIRRASHNKDRTRTEGSEVTGTDPFDMQPFVATTFVTSSIPPALVKLAPPEHSSATTRSNRSPQSNHNNTTIGELLNSSISFENNPSVIPPSEHRSSEFTNRMAETHSCGSVLYSLRRLSSLLNDYIERDTSTTSGSSLHFTSNIQPCSVATTSTSVNNPMTDHW